MKKVLLLITLMVQMTIAVAQSGDFQKAVARYKNAKTVTATATKITHRAALANDETTKGTLLMKQPSEVGIAMDGGKEGLLMQGSKFTMTMKGKKYTTDSQKNRQFVTFQAVFESILAGGAKDISQLSDLTVRKDGQQLVLTITPVAATKKEARRMLFTSFTLTIDTKTSELRSLRMNEKAGNYTEYKFTNFSFK